MSAPGIRNKNPGNLRSVSGTWWNGQTGIDTHGFCVFSEENDGIRALALQLIVYRNKHHLQSIQDYIGKWAPPSENDTKAYIDAVAARVGISRTADCPLNDFSVLYTLVVAIIEHENGLRDVREVYSDQLLSDAVHAALKDPQ